MALFASAHQDSISCDTLKMNQLCKVCGEPAAGFHFGAFTCEGCKSFFGRSYNNLSVISECKNGGQCVINKKNRTSCKACRLRKCLLVGMSKSGSRYGRRSNWFKLHCLMQEQSTPPPPSSGPGLNDQHPSSAGNAASHAYNSSAFHHPNHRRHYSLPQPRHPSNGASLRALPSSMSNESSSNKDDPEDYKTSSSPSVSSPADSHHSDSSSVELSEVKPSRHHLHHHHHPLHPYNFKLGATLTPIHPFYDGKDLFAPLAGLPHHLHAAAANLNLHQHQQQLQHAAAAVVAAGGGFLPTHFPAAQPTSLISSSASNSINPTSRYLGSAAKSSVAAAAAAAATLLPRKFHIDNVLQLGAGGGGHHHHHHPALPKLTPLLSPSSPESRAALAEQDSPMDLSFKGKQTCVEPGSPRCSDLDSDAEDFHDSTNEEHLFLFQRSDEDEDEEVDDLERDRVPLRKEIATPLDLTRK